MPIHSCAWNASERVRRAGHWPGHVLDMPRGGNASERVLALCRPVYSDPSGLASHQQHRTNSGELHADRPPR